jgi:uncharacterized membrane protein SpoIIM required for sporulation
MVLESILNPKKAEHKPWYVLIFSIIFSAIAIFLANILFPTQASILSIAFITIFFIPFFQRLFSYEEKKDEKIAAKKKHPRLISSLYRHRRLIAIFTAFFIGIIIVYSFIFTFVPESKNIFELQTQWFKGLPGSTIDANATFDASFVKYLFNNSQVMIIFFVLSVLFGAGAIFILSWNASIIAVYLGMVVSKYTAALGTHTAYVYGLSIGATSIIMHAIPEIGGYFFAGIAGGILSVGLIREKVGSKEFNEVFKDALLWLVIAELLIIIGALIEAGL